MSDIHEALELLDHDNDDHWQRNGKPSLAAVKSIMEELGTLPDGGVKRADIEHFSRHSSVDDAAVDDESDLKTSLSKLSDDIKDLQSKVADLKQKELSLLQQRDEIILQLEGSKSKHDDLQQIKSYISSFNRLNIERQSQKARILDSMKKINIQD